jgi:F-type H+-transporting ATPase subunit b
MGALGISISQLLTQVISFLILFFLLYKLAYGPLIKMLDSRSAKIKESLDAAERAKESVKESEDKIQAEISKARQEGQKLIADAREAASRIRDQEIKKAKEESELLIKKTKTEILNEKESAIESIRKDFAGLSIIAAEKIIKRSINQKDHETLIDEVLNTELDSIKK